MTGTVEPLLLTKAYILVGMNNHTSGLFGGFLIVASKFSLCCYLICQPALHRLFVTVASRVLIHFQNLKKLNVLF